MINTQILLPVEVRIEGNFLVNKFKFQSIRYSNVRIPRTLYERVKEIKIYFTYGNFMFFF